VDNTYNTNEWVHVQFSKAGGSAPMYIYTNGVQTDVTQDLPDLATGLRNFVYMGRSSVTASDPYYQGKFDEVRISKVPRSAGWARQDYATQRIGANAVRLGALDSTLYIIELP
jgi:hypothetical protein